MPKSNLYVKMTQMLSRRDFIKKSALAGAGLTLAGSLTNAIGASAPSNRVRVAMIGVNARGQRLIAAFASLPECDIAYVCDVDSKVLDKAVQVVTKAQGKAPKAETDFRRILEDPEVDAVVIASPDHWHAWMGVMAIQAGKHVYVEKPCSHTAHEGELLVEAARKHKRVVQMGNQRRSWSKVKEAISLIHGGEIGNVHHSRSWYANNRKPIGIGKKMAPPEHLDYDLWQGPAPRRPYQDNILPYNWHWFWNWGTGEAGNNAIHSLDLSRWGMQVEHPVHVVSTGGRYYYNDDWETPDTQMMSFEYEGGKLATWEGFSCNRLGAMGSGFGVTFHGDKGSIMIEGGNSYRVYDEGGKELRQVTPEVNEHRDAVHALNFLNGIRNGEELASDIAGGHVSTVMQHLGNISQRIGRPLKCDPKTGHILGDKEAAKYWTREYEPGWKLEV